MAANKNRMESAWTPILITAFVAFMVTVAFLALKWAPPSGADPLCGENSYYDYQHEICEAFPTPPPLLQYPDTGYPFSWYPRQEWPRSW